MRDATRGTEREMRDYLASKQLGDKIMIFIMSFVAIKHGREKIGIKRGETLYGMILII